MKDTLYPSVANPSRNDGNTFSSLVSIPFSARAAWNPAVLLFSISADCPSPAGAGAGQTRVGDVALAAAAALRTLFRWLEHRDVTLTAADQARSDVTR